jgi:hypothetical protein
MNHFFHFFTNFVVLPGEIAKPNIAGPEDFGPDGPVD